MSQPSPVNLYPEDKVALNNVTGGVVDAPGAGPAGAFAYLCEREFLSTGHAWSGMLLVGGKKQRASTMATLCVSG
jgi:hypothetical protein